jgi:hypothetical protein
LAPISALAHLIGKDAAEQVGRTARRERHDQAELPRRIVLRQSRRKARRAGERGGE